MILDTLSRHQTERFRQESKRRVLTVVRAGRLTPKMLRIEFASPELRDFSSRSADDHIKLLFPDPSAAQGRCMRDYAPRAFDTAIGTLTVDFALHQDGPATAWAFECKAWRYSGDRRPARLPDRARRLRFLSAGWR
jgi:NADPH-dependent ferric siderophore reductase